MKYFELLRRSISNFKIGLFEKYFISFCIIIILPIIIVTTIIYTYSVNLIETEVNASNRRILNNISGLTDDRIREVRETLIYLSSNTSLEKLIFNSSFNYDRFAVEYMDVRSELSKLLISRDYVRNVYLYIKEKDSILSSEGMYYFDDFFMNENHYDNVSVDDIKKLLSSDENFSILQTMKINGMNVVSAMARVPYHTEKYGTLVINIDAEKLFVNIKNNTDTKTEVLVLNENNKVMTHTGNSFLSIDNLEEIINATSTDNEDGLVINAGGIPTYLTWTVSSANRWKYIVLIPYRELISKSVFIRNLSLAACFFFLLIGIIISFIMSKKIYNPIKSIIENLKKHYNNTQKDVFTEKLNEFKIINNTIESVFAENTQLLSAFRQNRERMTEWFLYHLLKEGSIEFSEEYRRDFEELEQILKENTIIPVLVSLHYFYSIRRNLMEKEIKMLHSEIKLALEGLAVTGNHGWLIELDKNKLCIISVFPENSASHINELNNEILKEMEKYAQFLDYTIVDGECIQSYYDLNQCYLRMLDAFNNRLFCKKHQVLYLSEPEAEEGCKQPVAFTQEKQLKNALSNGDYRYSESIIKGVIQKLIDAGVMHSSAKIVLMEILNTALHTISDSGCNYQDVFDNYFLLYGQLDECSIKEEYEEFFEKVFLSITQYFAGRKNFDENEVIKKLLDFIEKNYSSQISLSLAAQQMGMSMGYFSKYFKDRVGVNFVDYLNKVRLDKAKELLCNKKIKIGEIAEKVGYLSSNTFNVVFKKYEGVSPGTYRNHQ